MHVHTLIIGAGPAGLACARILAEEGLQPLVIERKKVIGDKVCAGGITWGGLHNRIDADLIEKSFPSQHIVTRFQRTRIEEPTPIIATINRVRMGHHMAEQAMTAGAGIMTGCQVKEIADRRCVVEEGQGRRRRVITCDHLVGADGSNSMVRRHLGLATSRMGIGINYQIEGDLPDMEWHLDGRFFGNGYGWIFPHGDSVSIGAYADRNTMSARSLQRGLTEWATRRGFTLTANQAQADLINYDHRGWKFGRVFLVGDAAGLASGLTGEGIYPAILSGEETARAIIDPNRESVIMDRLTCKHRLHSRMVDLTALHPVFNLIAGESVTFALRWGIIRFNRLEMAV